MSDSTTKKDTKKTKKVNGKSSTVVEVTRDISDRNQLILCIQAGGRCEFDGCNRYLFEHHLTHKRFNFAQMAHIVAFSKRGPRGNVTDRPEDINSLDNLMLLCHPCHKQIDDFPEDFSRETLEGYKKAHEDRISLLTSSAPDRQTTAVILKAKIGGKPVKISPAEIYEAVSPRYPATRIPREIDLSGFDDQGDDFYGSAARKIKRDLENILDFAMDEDKTNHVSLFGLASMALLAYAGNLIGNKIPCDLYQKHKDTQDWKWKTDGDFAQYKFHRLTEGSDRKKVALILSLSGKIHLDTLPTEVTEDASVYEIILEGATPHDGFLRQKQDLTNFEVTYRRALREIGAEHGKLEMLHLFPAVPSPVAVACGRELMPKVDPVLVIYDDDKRQGNFKRIIEVNN